MMNGSEKKRIGSDVWFLLVVAWAAIASYQLITFGYGMMVPHIIEEFGIDYAVIGNIGSMASLVAVVANIPIAFVASKSNPRFTLPVLYLFYAIGGVVFSIAHTIPLLYIGRLVMGAAQAGMISCLVVVKARRIPAEKILDVNGIENFVQPLGQTCGTMFGAQLIALLAGWRNVYRMVSVLMLICAVLYIVIYSIVNKNTPIETQKADNSAVKEKEKNPLLQALSNKTVLLYAIAYPGSTIIWIAFFFYYPSYFMNVRGFTAAQAGLATGLFPIFSALASITFPKVARKLDINKAVIVGSHLCLAILYFVIVRIPNFAALCFVTAFTGYISYIMVPLYFSNVYKLGLPPRAIQMGTSILLTMVSVGTTIGSGVIGTLVNSYGLYLGLSICCATPLWFALFNLFAPDYSAKAMARRTAVAAQQK